MPRGRQPAGDHALSDAERQARYRARRQAGQASPLIRYRRPAGGHIRVTGRLGAAPPLAFGWAAKSAPDHTEGDRRAFPGYTSVGAFADYARCIAGHRARVRRIALVAEFSTRANLGVHSQLRCRR